MNFIAIAVGFGAGAFLGAFLTYISTRTHVEVKLDKFKVKASSVREAAQLAQEIIRIGKDLDATVNRKKEVL